MAAVVLGVATPDATDATSYVSGSFTPAAGDLLVATVVAADSVLAAPTLTDSQGLGWTLIDKAFYKASAYRVYVYVANTLAANSAMTVTFTCTADPATGAVIGVCRVSGMTRTGASAVRQSAKLENGTLPGASPTPMPTFGAACLTGNPTIVCAGNEESMGAASMTGMTQRANSSAGPPTIYEQVYTRDSGFTGTSIVWDDFGVSAYCVIQLELDTSAGGGSSSQTSPYHQRVAQFDPLLVTR